MKKRMVMRRNGSLTPLPLSKGRGECILLLGVSVFMCLLVDIYIVAIVFR